ncbi:MAG: anthranilate synthase component I family protein [Phycisphaerales bacterium]|nr:anthranilate synthase component I family protein [Phycisphaerales bacterium]
MPSEIDVASAMKTVLDAPDDGTPLCGLFTADVAGRNIVIRPTSIHRGQMPASLQLWRPASPTHAAKPDTGESGGWIFVLDYEHAEVFDPAVRCVSRDEHPTQPTAAWIRYEAESVLTPAPPDRHAAHARASDHSFHLGPLHSITGPDAFQASVHRALGHISAGDVYQINLTHRLEGAFSGSARALGMALVRRAKPWFGAYVELPADPRTGAPARVIASASPELFLTIDPATDAHGPIITTRPMKGTRADLRLRDDLHASEKERAELTMIIDLMRNDLGRVCQPGSVHVPALRTIEAHAAGTILQATGTVRGTLRPDITLMDVLRATFPPGSITGAPKIRAMQIIRALEPVARGPYCGVIGWVTDDGHAAMSVAIRTAVIERGRLHYGVGAGIVADSDPAAEWEETLAKAAIIRDLVSSPEHRAPH